MYIAFSEEEGKMIRYKYGMMVIEYKRMLSSVHNAIKRYEYEKKILEGTIDAARNFIRVFCEALDNVRLADTTYEIRYKYGMMVIEYKRMLSSVHNAIKRYEYEKKILEGTIDAARNFIRVFCEALDNVRLADTTYEISEKRLLEEILDKYPEKSERGH